MQLRPRFGLISLLISLVSVAAFGTAATPALAQGFGQAPHPAPYNYFGPDLYFPTGATERVAVCYYDNSSGRVCLD